MTATDESVRDLRQLYCRLMREIKMRLTAIDDTLAGKNPFPAFIAFEQCYLQLRMICELIALGCIAVHGDIPAARSKRFSKANRPDIILRELEELHPQFYPVPGAVIASRPGVEKIRIGGIGPYLTKSDLVALYAECGGVLHRGALRNMRTGASDDFSRLTQHVNKIVRLLHHHQIQLNDPDQFFWVVMHSEPDGGEVRATVMRAMSAPPVLKAT